jgi:pyridoxal 5'-phosphate synthase pdxS subunit
VSDPTKIAEIIETVSIPVMAKCRIGHFVEAQNLQALGVDYINEYVVLTPGDEDNHLDKEVFKVPQIAAAAIWGRPSGASPRVPP